MISSIFKTLAAATVATLLFPAQVALAQAAQPMENPYQVERTWPEYFLEHQKLFTDKQGTYKAGKYPVWTVHVPAGWIGNATIIEGDDGLIVYDTSVNTEAGKYIAQEIRKISNKPIKAIFYSHHHTDHYNGTSALVTPEQVANGSVKIYAWDNFEEEVANEFGALLPRAMQSFAGTASAQQLIESWRYQVDADKAGDTHLLLGFELSDSGTELAVELRNSIIELHPGIPAGASRVKISTSQLQQLLAGADAGTIKGDSKALTRLLGYLDRSPPSFSMHLK